MSPVPVLGADDADWASRVADQLPASDIRQLARAAAAGPPAVRALRERAGSPVLRSTCDELLLRLAAGSKADPAESLAHTAALAGMLAGAGRATARARTHRQLDVVWTGPEPGTGANRLTAATITDLIGQARRELTIVSYATRTEPAIDAALTAAAGRGVEITLLIERHEDNPAYSATGTPFQGLDAIRLHWPKSERPPGAALHAKIIVVDDRIALVGSANFTTRAMESNLECGFLVQGGPQPAAIRAHLIALLDAGCLRRLPG